MRVSCRLVAAMLVVGAFFGSAWAVGNAGLTPLSLVGVPVVDVATVTSMKEHGAVRLVDTRALHDFLAGHIPDALHVDYRERSARGTDFNAAEDDIPAFLARLGKFVKPEQIVVFYCNGPSCWKSYKGAVAAREAQYRHVFWFRGGMSEWQQQGRPVVAE